MFAFTIRLRYAEGGATIAGATYGSPTHRNENFWMKTLLHSISQLPNFTSLAACNALFPRDKLVQAYTDNLLLNPPWAITLRRGRC